MHRVMIVYEYHQMEWNMSSKKRQTWSCTFFKEATSTAYFNLISGAIRKDHLT